MPKFAFNVPLARFVSPSGPPMGEAVRIIASQLEACGIAGALMSEHPAPSTEWLRTEPAAHLSLDPISALAFIAAHSKTLTIFTNILVLPYRNPFLTAKSAATLQILSDNRFVLGAGVGYLKAEFDALGVDHRERGKLTDEAIETIREAWRGQSVVKKGMYFNAGGNEVRPAPSVPPPIWIGGGSDRAVQRAADHGDGWLPYFTTTTADAAVMRSAVVSMEHFSEKLKRLHARRQDRGRTEPFDIVVSPPFRPQRPDSESASRFLEEAKELESRGANWIWTTMPAETLDEYLDAIEWFGSEIVGRFEAANRSTIR